MFVVLSFLMSSSASRFTPSNLLRSHGRREEKPNASDLNTNNFRLISFGWNYNENHTAVLARRVHSANAAH